MEPVVAKEQAGFLSRWSSRKTDVLKGKPLDEPVRPAQPMPGLTVQAPVATASAELAAAGSKQSDSTKLSQAPQAPEVPETPEKLLSLDDVKLLTKDSDFKPFMAQNFGPEVRNAAMKKLFADPHFNVMDGLDIYIDDYSISDPIPESMLRQMTSAHFLKLFDDEDEKAENLALPEPSVQDNHSVLSAQPDPIAAQSTEPVDLATNIPVSTENLSPPELLPEAMNSTAIHKDHVHTDLRLQPDHAAQAPDIGRSTS